MKKGYTLIELLIVIVIMGIVFSIGYVNFQDYSRQQALLAAVRSIETDIHQTQEYALSGNIPAACTTLLNNYKFNVTSSTTYEIDATCTPNTTIQIKIFNVAAGMTIAAPNPNPIVFKTLGQGTNIASGGTARIVVTQTLTGKTRTITIGETGNVQ